jgi:hypothetical protein
METVAHLQLKRLSLVFLRAAGCMAFANEVRCPISRYRVDCVGYKDRDVEARTRCPARTIVIECKQSRADFLRDRETLEPLLKLRTHLETVRQSIEAERIRREEPHLRRAGTSLFAEMDEWDFAASRLPAYRKVLRRLRQLDEQIHGQTKFFVIARCQLADRLYVAAPRGMIRPCELPRGWGLLECSARCLEDVDVQARFDEPPALRMKVEAAELRPRADFRLRMLRNIAVAATMAAHQRGEAVSRLSASAAPA